VRIVIKIGTSSLTNEHGVIDHPAMVGICDQAAQLRKAGHEVLLVSSGAVSAGVGALGLPRRPTDMPTLQALAAAGQPRLMEVYNAELGRHGIVAAQVLVVPPDFVNRRQYLHARQTLTRLVELGCIPIVNENDAIASDEIRWGDNDRIAALLANLVRADLLVLLTDTDGLFTADPRTDPTATLIPRVAADDPILAVDAGRSGSNRGSGGMASKLTAARIASWSGVQAVIARSVRPNVIVDAVAGVAGVGTVFEAHDRHLTARKLWIAFSSAVAGTVHVDEGARRALTERNTSLLPAGVTGVGGGFELGDTVEIVAADGTVIARGMAAMDAATARRLAGRRTKDFAADDDVREVIHRDDLVLLLGVS
jgi:glutamate 5-kinase